MRRRSLRPSRRLRWREAIPDRAFERGAVDREYTVHAQPSDCQNATTYPGSIDIWVNGVKWNHSDHGQTGGMSQYSVVPKANGSALNIGTMALDSWFSGAIGKVAIYEELLSQAQITAHYQAMTGSAPTGSCADTCSF